MDVAEMSAAELVEELGATDGVARHAAYEALVANGLSALGAVHAGLEHKHWQVRRWCAMALDRLADGESIRRLIPLLSDDNSLVRLWATHSLACDQCKAKGVENPVDVVPLLIDRVRCDKSIRVRRMAAAMLANHHPDERAIAVFRAVLDGETDRKLRLHATFGLRRTAAACLVKD